MLEFTDTGQGPALVLLHGAGVDLDLWAPQMAAYSAQYRVIALNLPGHGDSPWVTDGVPGMTDAVIETLDTLRIGRFAVIGLSLGGMVGLEIAARWADRTSHLILVESVPYVASTSWAKGLFELALLPLRMIPPAMMAKLPNTSMGAQTKAAGQYVKGAMAKMDRVTTHRILRAALHYDGRPRLVQVRAPTLVMVGQHNRATHRRAQEAASGIKAAQFEVVRGAGHILNRDAAAYFTDRTLRFLRQVT